MKMIKRTLMTMAMAAVMALTANAVPARPGQWKVIRLADGTEIRAELKGDEFVSYYMAEDGRRFVRADKDIYRMATAAEIHQLYDKNRAEMGCEALASPAAAMQNGPKRVAIGGDHIDFTGSKRCLCILVEFADKMMLPEHTQQTFKDLINKIGFKDEAMGAVGSVRDYFLAQSNGTFDMQFDVVGPYTLSRQMSYYGAPNGNAHDAHAADMIKEAVQLANYDVDYKNYDWDGDGVCEAIFVIYAGMGQADGGDENTIWPHKSTIGNVRLDGVTVRDYACGSELNGRGTLDGIGTMCHEYSHCLGLPDFYDVCYNCNINTPKSWSIMDSGTYNGQGNIPAAYNAWERYYCGWLDPVELSENCHVEGMKPLTSGGDAYVIFNDENSNEYFILENRAKEGFDAGLYGEGLLAYHVDFESYIWNYNLVNCTQYPDYNNHGRFQIMPADNSVAETSATAVKNDAFPYGSRNSIWDYSRPATTLYRGSKGFLGKPVTNITRAEDGTISFDFSTTNPEAPELPEGMFFYESFDQCNGQGGNDGTYSLVTKDDIISDNYGWETKTGYAGYKCACFGTPTVKGTVTTPEISLADAPMPFNNEIAFRVMPYNKECKSVTLEIWSDKVTMNGSTEISLTYNEWTDVVVKLSGKGTFSMSITANSRRFFLDEVKVGTHNAIADAIDGVYTEPLQRTGIVYNLQGQRVAPNTKGLLIIDGKKQFVK